MQPDDLSVPRGDNKIKEKLNLHLKKRLQETGKSSTTAAAEPPPSSSTGPPVSPAASSAAGPKTKKQKTKHSPSTSSAGASAGSSASTGAVAGCSSSKNPEHLMLSPGALGGGNSNDTTNSSFNSVDLDPDANLSNDGQERSAGEKGSTKVNTKPDIFTMILNEKKSSLMRDPEVIKFLTELMEQRNKS